MADVETASGSWSASGAAGLSGRAGDNPLPVPARLVQGVIDHGAAIGELSESLGRRVDLDWLALLGERAAIAGLSRGGDVSCGGATRLLSTATDWIALSLARPDDIASMPAWLEASLPDDVDELWVEITRCVASREAVELIDRAWLLGLPASRVGERVADRPSMRSAVMTPVATGAVGTTRLDELLVVDLSSLWAGPLCANLLGLAGCRIVKVESTGRPDGARFGSTEFYEVLHGGHESVGLDFTSAQDLVALRALIERADIVIEASRPRAFAALGVDRATVDGPAVWLSIAGHGRDVDDAQRIAFGDDAAAAGGLVTEDADGLCFCCDAVADPLTGIVAAHAVLDALVRGGRWVVDVALSGVAASMSAGPMVSLDSDAIASPRARAVVR
ncbi:MAG: CoA transferase, partial [Ilumatobacteraceae bacterium]